MLGAVSPTPCSLAEMGLPLAGVAWLVVMIDEFDIARESGVNASVVNEHGGIAAVTE